MKEQNGFSLVELLIVAAIILVTAAIAIPNLMRSRMAANESSAVGSLRTINTAESDLFDFVSGHRIHGVVGPRWCVSLRERHV